MLKLAVIVHLTLAVALSASLPFNELSKTNPRIVGGSSAPEGQYPYQVSLRYGNKHICGGSIIHKQWIVTAAHCVAGVPTSTLKVVVGSNSLSDANSMYNVTEVNIHENYNSFILRNDVAMLRVKPINFTHKVSPIVLDGEHIGDGKNCTLSGWGMKLFPGPTPNYMQHINLTTITAQYCKKLVHPIDDTQLCTLTKAEEGACRYDSGGPLVRNVNGTTKQIGVVSWGILCALGYPDVYSRVSSYIDWFRQICHRCI